MCHGKAQYVPQHDTKRLLDLCATAGKAQNVPHHGTKILSDSNDERIEKKNNKKNNNKAILRAGRAVLAAKNAVKYHDILSLILIFMTSVRGYIWERVGRG
jgi:hypothetical protein